MKQTLTAMTTKGSKADIQLKSIKTNYYTTNIQGK
jgi:hypothetical protein